MPISIIGRGGGGGALRPWCKGLCCSSAECGLEPGSPSVSECRGMGSDCMPQTSTVNVCVCACCSSLCLLLRACSPPPRPAAAACWDAATIWCRPTRLYGRTSSLAASAAADADAAATSLWYMSHRADTALRQHALAVRTSHGCLKSRGAFVHVARSWVRTYLGS